MSHYDVLGVTASASADELRRAYRSRASRLHPDKHTGETTQARASAEQDMQRLNEAWHVLSDAGRRQRYDQGQEALRTAPPTPPRVPRSDRPDVPISTHDPAVPTLLRILPLGFLLLVLLAIFVFAAFALRGPDQGGDSDTATSLPSPASVAAGDCILVQRGRISALVPCGGPNDGQVTRVIPRAGACVGGEDRVDSIDGSHAICTVATGP